MANKDFYLLLGEADREAVTTSLKNAKARYVKKRLESTLANWQTIYPIIEDPDNKGIVAKISNPTLSTMFSAPYSGAVEKMLSLISAKPHVVFVHESFYKAEQDHVPFDDDDPVAEWYHVYGSVSSELRENVVSAFERHKIDVRAYGTNVEFSIEAVEFIEDQRNNLIFRMYVSDKRIWSGEIRKIIGLFKDYLTKVCGVSVTQEEYSTPSGTVYELGAVSQSDIESVSSRFAEFTSFLDASSQDVQRATQMLVDQSISQSDAEDIVRRYAKEARRLHIDFRQERERKLLDVRHRMESELTDVVQTESEWDQINRFVEQSMPSVYSISGAIGLLPSPQSFSQPTILVNPQIIGTVNGIVAQAVNGNQSFGPTAEQMVALINEYGGREALALTSDLQELEDEAAKVERRLAAKGRLLSFLGKVGSKAGELAIGVMQSYIETKLGIK